MQRSLLVTAILGSAALALGVYISTHPALKKETAHRRTAQVLIGTATVLTKAPEPRMDDCTIPDRKAVDEAVRKLRAPGSLAKQNGYADSLKLPRVVATEDLKRRLDQGHFVPLAETNVYHYAEAFAEVDPANRDLYKNALPHMKPFLDDLLGEAYRCFAPSMIAAEDLRIARLKRDREVLIEKLSKRRDKRAKKMLADMRPLDLRRKFDRFPIESLLRTDAYQKRLIKNGKWPAARGDTDESRTVHTTGSTIDIGLGNLPPHVRDWIRVRLARLEQEGCIDAIEERGRYSVCAHIMVLPHPTATTKANDL